MELENIEILKKSKRVFGLPLFLFATFFLEENNSKETQIIILPDQEQKKLTSFFAFLDIKNKIFSPFFVSGSEREEEINRTAFLLDLIDKDKDGILVIPASSFENQLPSPAKLLKKSISFDLNTKIDLQEITTELNAFDFQKEKKTLEPATFSIRGDILEVFPINSNYPIRLETDFGVIKKIYSFNPKNQQKVEALKKCEVISKAKTNDKGSIMSYLELAAKIKNIHCFEYFPEQIKEIIDPLSLGTYQLFLRSTKNSKRTIFDDFEVKKSVSDKEEQSSKQATTFKKDDLIPFHVMPEHFMRALREKKDYSRICITKEPEKVKSILANEDFYPTILKRKDFMEVIKKKQRGLFLYPLEKKDVIPDFVGFFEEKTKLLLFSDRDIFLKKIKQKRGLIDTSFLNSLKEGDFVVHIDHGVGRFIAMRKRIIDEGEREFFLLEYAMKDKIYLPVEYADKIAKYIGAANPKINRLHEASFKEAKKKIKIDTQKIAKELLETQALRKLHQGFNFQKEQNEDEFIALFPFDETDSQTNTWEEIAKDLESEKPMDRLVCGDVGFGKTEIAMRAAFRVVSNNKQVTLLSPTTILAKQHFETFSKRFEKFPYEIVQLSRLKNLKEQKTALEKIKNGKANIVIGTHRLLSKDISFFDLGLIVIDEEQRFGVKAKEKLKHLRSKVDILTLTATPIPRTLHMSLSGLKDISTLTTPPAGRVPIKTTISKTNEPLVSFAINEELERKGQVYFLHNRVRTIEAATKKLEKLLPNASFGIVHGQLPPNKIAKTMVKFKNREIDVLVCSSIIENGLDMPNVNTLIVADATRFGLSQLYQLRGRIGRGKKKAHAYFLYKTQNLSEKAKKRLSALLAAKKLGSGFELAMRDLEIRGAGNILGKEQSGRVKAIGLSHYLKLLNTAVLEIKTGKKVKELDVSIDLPLDAYIPREVVEDENERLSLYQNIASIDTMEKLIEKEKELLLDLKVPEFENLFYLLKLKILAKNADIKNIDTKIFLNPDESTYKKIVISFDVKTDYKKAYQALEKFPGMEVLERKVRIDFLKLGVSWKEKLKEIVEIFSL